VGEGPGPDLPLDEVPFPSHRDVADPVGMSHHLGQRVGRAPDAPDGLDDVVALPPDTDHPDGRERVEAYLNVTGPHPGTLPEQGAVPPDIQDHSSGLGMVVAAEGGTGP